MPFKIKHFGDFRQTGGGAKDDKAIAFQSSLVVDVHDRQSTCGRSEYPRIYFENCGLNTTPHSCPYWYTTTLFRPLKVHQKVRYKFATK